MRQGAGPHLRRHLIVLAVVSVVYLLITLFVTNSYYQLILTLVPVWALFGVSWNILSGYGGQLSFGHASFFGIGAYTVTLTIIYWGLSPWLGIPLGGILGGVAAILIGFPTFRLRGHYFALSMLAYPLAILYVMQYLGFQEVSIPMHRENGLAFMEFSEPRIYTLIAVLLLMGGVVVSLIIENSRFGLALLAIRQNELAAEAAGINARLWKMRSLVVSGVMGAVAGGFYARVLVVVTPDSVFGMLVSAQAVVVTLFGGVASVWGPVIGAAILVPLAETLQAELGTYLPGIQGVVYGVAIIAVMLLSPDGLFWTVRDRWLRRETPQPIPDIGPDADAGPGLQAARIAAGGAAPPGRRAVARLRRPPRGQRGQLLGHRGGDPRHHRAERRGEDDAVQRAERRARRRRGLGPARRAAHAGQEDPRGLPHGCGPHVPGRAQLHPPPRARQRARRRVRRRAVRSGRHRPGGAGAPPGGIARSSRACPPASSPTSSCA